VAADGESVCYARAVQLDEELTGWITLTVFAGSHYSVSFLLLVFRHTLFRFPLIVYLSTLGSNE